MCLIDCRDVTLSYEGKTVVTGLTVQVCAGDYLCIVGENGSGKSTLMKALLGLKKPLSGVIRLGDGVTRADIGYMPQQSGIQRDFPATVQEVVQSGLRSGRPFFSKADKARLQHCLTLMEIQHLARRPYRLLSGGQQQRVLLARAMCAANRLLLLDEPAAGLDPAITAQLYRLINTLHRTGVTVVMISHDIPAAVKYATHILHLRHKPLFCGAAAEYADSPIGRRFLKGGDAR